MNRKYSNLGTPLLIKGDLFTDDRGSLSFVNDFIFDDVNRFYIIKHTSSNIIRAWQAHQKEVKFFFVLQGVFIINLVKINNWEEPARDSKVINYKLSRKENNMIVIPKGYANGFTNLENDSELLVFSSSSLNESLEDDFRYDKNHFINCNWGI